ncbi:MAG: right-handed parallel beta-helix repeat-containing protein [Planctomycetes bacterium]|nr:right-handed parallel beta-helix repeat-containing protein [Planctomycetota bacterium]
MKAAEGLGKFSVMAVAVAAVLALGAVPAQATTYYVSQSSGDDGWTGQAANPEGTSGPWKTLAKASMIDYVAGDRILLKCGDTWNEELHPKGNAAPDKPIFIGSFGEGKKPVIDREDYNQDRIGIHLADQEGFKIVGIEFARCMTGIYAEYSDGCPTKKFIWIEDCYFRDSLKYGHYETYPNPRNIGLGICFFSDERDNKIVLTDITIKNCVFRRLASGVWTNSPDNFNKNASFIYNFGNMTFDGCLFEEGYQWQMGIRGVDGGAVRNCVTHDIGRGFRAFNGVAGAMFFRCRNWVFEDSEWGFVDIGQGSGDGEAFDFEGNCDNITMRNCLFHDTDGPGFLICLYASDWNPNRGIRMENCVLNGKAKRPIRLPRCEIVNTTDWNEVMWKNCRFYLSKGEVLMAVMDREKEKRSTFVNCGVKNLSDACGTPDLAARATVSASSQEPGYEAAKAIDRNAATAWKAASANDQWLELVFSFPQAVNSFKIKEDASSSITRYVIECWDAKSSRWVGCFNGRAIGPEFMAPIVGRTTKKVRLLIVRTNSGNPAISAFEVYNDTAGWRPVKATGDL